MIRDINGLHRDIMNIPVKEDCTITSEYRLGHRDARHAAAELVNGAVALESNKQAPVQGYPEGIPWAVHMEAYAAYCKRWRPQPALIEGWCRGGFSMGELDEFVPDWRNKVSEIYRLKVRILELHKEVEKLKVELGLKGLSGKVLIQGWEMEELTIRARQRVLNEYIQEKELMTTAKTQSYTVTVNGITHSVPVPEVFPVAGGPGYVTKAAYLQLMKEYLFAASGKSVNPPLIPVASPDIADDTIRIPEGYRLIKDDYTHIFWAIAASIGPTNGKSATISYSKFMNYLKAHSDLDESKIQYILKSAPIPED